MRNWPLRLPNWPSPPFRDREYGMALPAGKAMRAVFGEALTEVAQTNPRVVVLDGDVASSTGAELFEAEHPDRFLQMGVAEQNMLGVAAGLAHGGFRPDHFGFCMFRSGPRIRLYSLS